MPRATLWLRYVATPHYAIAASRGELSCRAFDFRALRLSRHDAIMLLCCRATLMFTLCCEPVMMARVILFITLPLFIFRFYAAAAAYAQPLRSCQMLILRLKSLSATPCCALLSFHAAIWLLAMAYYASALP